MQKKEKEKRTDQSPIFSHAFNQGLLKPHSKTFAEMSHLPEWNKLQLYHAFLRYNKQAETFLFSICRMRNQNAKYTAYIYIRTSTINEKEMKLTILFGRK